MRFGESPRSSGQVDWRKPARKLPSRGSCSAALKQGMQWEWGSPALFFASATHAPHLLLLLPLIFHSFDKYHLSPTMCRHAINMDTPVPFSLFPIFSLSFPPSFMPHNLSFLFSGILVSLQLQAFKFFIRTDASLAQGAK